MRYLKNAPAAALLSALMTLPPVSASDDNDTTDATGITSFVAVTLLIGIMLFCIYRLMCKDQTIDDHSPDSQLTPNNHGAIAISIFSQPQPPIIDGEPVGTPHQGTVITSPHDGASPHENAISANRAVPLNQQQFHMV